MACNIHSFIGCHSPPLHVEAPSACIPNSGTTVGGEPLLIGTSKLSLGQWNCTVTALMKEEAIAQGCKVKLCDICNEHDGLSNIK